MKRIAVQLISVAYAVAFTACRALSTEETKLVGTWKQFTIEGPIEITLKADHTYLMVGGIAEGPVHGRWHVEGSDLVLALNSSLPMDPIRVPIWQFTHANQRVRTPEGSQPSNQSLQRQ